MVRRSRALKASSALGDTQGLVLNAKVHSANVQDRDGGKLLLKPVRTPLPKRLSYVRMDAGYSGEGKGAD